MHWGLALTLTVCLGLAAAPGTAEAQGKVVTIGTGGLSGAYYPAGGAICRLVNKERQRHGTRCWVESTAGSVYNLYAVRAGELDIGMAQSDWHYHAVKGTAQFSEQGPDSSLRSLFSLHPESFTVVARADSGVTDFMQLAGRKVNIGNAGSGQRGTMEVVMEALGWTRATFAASSELRSSEQSMALCSGKFEAMVFMAGHPNGSIKDATASCDARLVSVGGPAIDGLVASHPYYRSAVIAGGSYRGNPADVKTFGVTATVVSSTRVPADTVYEVVRAVFEDIDAFRKLHPVLDELDPESMRRQGLTAPLHDGAVRYYRERGWM